MSSVNFSSPIKAVFNGDASALSDAEKALNSWGIDYTKRADGSLFVPGSLDLSNKGLTSLPDLSNLSVGGDFYCYSNQLTSLAGAPQSVGGGFWCNDNELTSLAGAPQSVGGDFSCGENQLTSLAGAPQSVGGGFWCSDNELTSLAGAPQSVGGDFSCSKNQLTSLAGAPQSAGGGFWCNDNELTSLAGAPQSVGGDFSCYSNQLTSLEGAPKAFKKLTSDLGEFLSWDEVPEALRVSAETKARQAEEAVQRATVLQSDLTILPSIKLKRR